MKSVDIKLTQSSYKNKIHLNIQNDAISHNIFTSLIFRGIKIQYIHIKYLQRQFKNNSKLEEKINVNYLIKKKKYFFTNDI